MTVPTYSAEDHKRAYQSFRETGNLSEVSRTQNISSPTIQKWKSATWICPFGCPYHGWDSLLDEGRRVSDAKTDLIAQNNFDPVKVGEMIEGIVGEKPVLAEVSPTVAVTLTERARLAHWMYLYCHVFYQLTEIALDHLTLRDALAGTFRVEATSRYGRGLRLSNAADGVRVLALCQDQIRNLEASINGFTPGDKKGLPVKPVDPFDGLGPSELRKALKTLEQRSEISGIVLGARDEAEV